MGYRGCFSQYFYLVMISNKQVPKHGGHLNQAIKKYTTEKQQIPAHQWLDLSTGINPNGWPVPTIPQAVYNRLPETDDGLNKVAQSYYQVAELLSVSGSQEAIQLLPQIFYHHLYHHSQKKDTSQAKIGIISPCYAEHAFQWQRYSFELIPLSSEQVDSVINELDVLLIINPNNPTGEVIHYSIVKKWLTVLQKNNAYLIIDEAFMDSTPEQSILNHLSNSQRKQLIVLRSIGKFFGLAGVRCGFVIAQQEILSLLSYYQGPWPVSGPTRWLVKKVLSDHQWIEKNKIQLHTAAKRLEILLTQAFYSKKEDVFIIGTTLFKTVFFNNITMSHLWFDHLAYHGILVRLLDNKQGLRFGLPKDEQQWQRLETVLKEHSIRKIKHRAKTNTE
jgi:cobalamin biosynthetic protein CobC